MFTLKLHLDTLPEHTELTIVIDITCKGHYRIELMKHI